MNSSLFGTDTIFVRAKTDAKLPSREYIDIDGDGSGDIMLDLQNGTDNSIRKYPVHPNRLTIVGDDGGLQGFKEKEEESHSSSQRNIRCNRVDNLLG